MGRRGHCPCSWPALLRDGWQWPGCPPGDSRPGLGPSPKPEEQGGPGPGIQGCVVLSRPVGPACIFLWASVAATQLMCTAAHRPACPCPCAPTLPFLKEWGEGGLGTLGYSHTGLGVGGREQQRNK